MIANFLANFCVSISHNSQNVEVNTSRQKKIPTHASLFLAIKLLRCWGYFLWRLLEGGGDHGLATG
jgi:hypothetical protein